MTEMKIHAMQVSSLAVSSGGKKASNMDWNMILFCSLCYLHKKREYCITLLAHPCPVVFLRGQYPCLVPTVSCFFLSLLPFHFHFPSPFLSSSLCHLSLCRSYRLFVASFPSSLHSSRICCQFIIIFLINLSCFILFCVGMWSASQVGEPLASNSFL